MSQLRAQERFASLSAQPLTVVSGEPKHPVGAIFAVFRHHEMLNLLVRRDLKARYKDSALGFVWSLIKPLTQLLIYYIVMGHFLGAARGIPDFAIFVFTGLTAYGLFSEVVSGATSSLVSNSGLIKKIYLPREVFPLASVGSAIFNFAMQLCVLIVATIVLGRIPLHAGILYFFPAFILLLVWSTALGILFSAINVYLRDMQYLIELVVMTLMWASPVVYSWEMVQKVLGTGVLLQIYTDNPITLAVLGFQRAFWIGGDATAIYPDYLLARMLIAIAVGIVAVFLCHRVFVRLQGNFAQEL